MRSAPRVWPAALLLATVSTAYPAEPQILLDGVSGARADNVRAHLGVAGEPCDSEDSRLQSALRRLPAEVDAALRVFGHYQATVTPALERGGDCWRLRLAIDPGPVVRLRKVDAGYSGPGAEDPLLRPVADSLRLDTGDRLDHRRYQEAKQALENAAVAQGYRLGSFARARLAVDPVAGFADVEIEYATGPLLRFGAIEYDSLTFDRGLIDDLIGVRAGEPFTSARLLELRRSLGESGRFERVEIDADPAAAVDNRVPVRLTLVPRKRFHYSVGAEYSTDLGPAVTAAFENRRVNRRGHTLRTELRASPVAGQFGVEYRFPRIATARPESFGLDAELAYDVVDTGTTQSARLGGDWRIEHEDAWRERRGIELLHERFDDGDKNRAVTLLTPLWGFDHEALDDARRPRKGRRWSLNLRGSPGPSTQFTQIEAGIGWLDTIGPLKLRLRTGGGATWVSDFEKLPTRYRFYAGGDRSVRGYDYRTLGPKSNDGDVIGGRYFATASAEIELPVHADWGVAAFADTGNAWNDWGGLNSGIGVGARWYSPLGPVELDLAHPLDDPDTDLRVHLRVGIGF